MRAAHVRDGVAMVLALSELERDVAMGQKISEVDVDARTTASRAKQDKFLGKRDFSRGGVFTDTWVLVNTCRQTSLNQPFVSLNTGKHG